MKILFFSYSGYPQHSDNFIPNPGPAILASVCRRLGHEAVVLDLNRPRLFLNCRDAEAVGDFLCDRLECEQPDVLGVTTWVNAYRDVALILSRVKQRFPKLMVIGGGYHATWFEEYFLQNLAEITGQAKPVYDVLLLGEGEQPLTDFLEFFEGKRELSAVAGALYFENGRFLRGLSQTFLPLRDEAVPLPDWSSYENLREFWPIFPLDISRGCPFHCIMCAHESMSGRKLRSRKMRTVANGIKHDFETFGVRHFRVCSSMFPRTLIEEFVNELEMRKDLPQIYWTCFGRVSDFHDPTSPAFLTRMKNVGCLAIFFGIESADEEILRRLGKNITIEWAEKAVAYTKQSGIAAVASVMTGNPGETPDQVEKTVNFLLRIAPDSAPSIALTPLPRTPLAEEPAKYGYELHPQWKKGILHARLENTRNPDEWSYAVDFYRQPCTGLSFLDYAKLCGDLSRRMTQAGIGRQPDEAYLMAHLLNRPSLELFLEQAQKLKSDDLEYFRKQILSAWERIDTWGEIL
ncbi:MAG: radical SAM protein [Candidatus Ozemobacteraceae bacterium]